MAVSNTDPSWYNFALYLPAIQNNYMTFVPKKGGVYDYAAHNFFDSSKGFYCPHILFSAGHALKSSTSGLLETRDENSLVFGDSGGYQIATGTWPLKTSASKRPEVLKWLETYCDIGTILDLPTKAMETYKDIDFSYKDCFDFTYESAAYFEKNQNGDCLFLNVIQGRNTNEALDWYNGIKHFDLQGWAFAGNQSTNLFSMIKLLILMRDEDHLLNKKWLHALGVSTIYANNAFTSIQRALRDIGIPITISHDSASPSHVAKHLGIVMPASGIKTTGKMDLANFGDYKTLSEYLKARSNEEIKTFVGISVGPKEMKTNTTGTEEKTYHALTNHNMEQTERNFIEARREKEYFECNIHDVNLWEFKNLVFEIFRSQTPMDLLDKHRTFLENVLIRKHKPEWHVVK